MENNEQVQTKHGETGQVGRYVVWGIVTVIFNVYLFYLLYTKANMNYQLANIIDWFFTVIFAFIVNKLFVFKSKSTALFKEVISFFGTRVLSLVLELILLWLFISILTINPTISKIIGHGVALVLNYFLIKLLFMKI